MKRIHLPARSAASRCLTLGPTVVTTLALLAPPAFAGINQDLDDITLSGLAFTSGNGAAGIAAARSSSHDVAARFFRLTGGADPAQAAPLLPETGSKGGPAKGSLTLAPPEASPWEVYGGLHYRSESQDSQWYRVGSTEAATLPGFLQVHPDTDSESFGGTVGIERRIGRQWRLGFAVGGSSTDVEMSLAGTSEIDSIALTPYVTFVEPGLWGFADFWAGLLYTHGVHDFDLRRLSAGGLATASPEATTGQLELLTGMKFHTGGVTHGPFAGGRWLEGTLDAYNEAGPTGLFPNQDLKSLASLLGYELSYAFESPVGTLVPWLRATWEHEFDDKPNRLLGISMADRDEDVAVLGAGVGYGLANGWNLWLDYEARISSGVEAHRFGLGTSYRF